MTAGPDDRDLQADAERYWDELAQAGEVTDLGGRGGEDGSGSPAAAYVASALPLARPGYRKERWRAVGTLVSLALTVAVAWLSYPGDFPFVPFGWVPWWVFAVVAGAELGDLGATARLLPDLWDEAE